MTGLSLHFDMTAHFPSYVILLTVPEALCFGVVRPSVRVCIRAIPVAFSNWLAVDFQFSFVYFILPPL